MSADIVRVLVVDDSALVRETVKRGLSRLDGWEVQVAGDPVVALDRIRSRPPDVILLDLEMPKMDGSTFLRHLMSVRPTPVVVLSSHTRPGSEIAARVRDLGAVEVLSKPELGLKDFLDGEQSKVVDALRRAAATAVTSVGWGNGKQYGHGGGGIAGASEPGPALATALTRHVKVEEAEDAAASGLSERIVVIGASMGGPTALREVLAAFPADGPPCLVVQHMMEGFGEPFARRLDDFVAMRVRRAESGDLIRAGTVLIAPEGRQMEVEGPPTRPRVRVFDGPAVRFHRPSVDVLFKSAARVLGNQVVAALLTGIGDDGSEGIRALRDAGAATLAQDEGTAVAFGMPGAAIERGGVEEVLPLEQIGPALVELARPESGHVRLSRSAGKQRGAS